MDDVCKRGDIGYRILDISIIVMCDTSDVIEYDRSRSELPNAPLHMKQYTISIEQYPL